MRRLRDFESVLAMLSEREIDGMQAAIDARREARKGRDDPPQEGGPTTQADAAGPGAPRGGRRAG